MQIEEKYFLDRDKTINYVLEHIESGNSLSKKIIEKINFQKGQFFTFLPLNAVMDRLYTFSYGGIIPSICCTGELEINDEPRELSKFIFNHLQKDPDLVVAIENVMLNSYDKYIEISNVKNIIYKE